MSISRSPVARRPVGASAFDAAPGSDTNVAATRQSFVLTQFPASIAFDRNILAASQAFALTMFPAAISLDRNIQATSQAFTLTQFPATIGSAVVPTIEVGVVRIGSTDGGIRVAANDGIKVA